MRDILTYPACHVNTREYRSFKMESEVIPSSDGSSVVRIGDTIIYCGIKAELVLSENCDDSTKFVIINFDFSPLIYGEYKFGNCSEETQHVTQNINELWDASPLIKESELIINEKVRWVLFVDISCVSRDGAVLDASFLSDLTNCKIARRRGGN
ncbi:hypothetical protein MXB_3841 [Myxobolus squamalis]|nr:hypothetical protein MXB_3841 [Myxobolus squamalis]